MFNDTLNRFVKMLNVISAVLPLDYTEINNKMIDFLEKEQNENKINWEIKCLFRNLFKNNTEYKLNKKSINIYSDNYDLIFYKSIEYMLEDFKCDINTFRIPRIEPIKYINDDGKVYYYLYVSNNFETIFPTGKYGINVITCRDTFWYSKSEVLEKSFLFNKEILLDIGDIITFFNKENKKINSIKELIEHKKIKLDYRGFIEIKEQTELCDDFVSFLKETNNYNASDILSSH